MLPTAAGDLTVDLPEARQTERAKGGAPGPLAAASTEPLPEKRRETASNFLERRLRNSNHPQHRTEGG